MATDKPEEPDELTITDEDRKRYPYHTDGSIEGIKRVALLHDDELSEVLSDKSRFEELRLQIGGDTNPNWLKGQIAASLYDRGLINEQEFDNLSR